MFIINFAKIKIFLSWHLKSSQLFSSIAIAALFAITVIEPRCIEVADDYVESSGWEPPRFINWGCPNISGTDCGENIPDIVQVGWTLQFFIKSCAFSSLLHQERHSGTHTKIIGKQYEKCKEQILYLV